MTNPSDAFQGTSLTSVTLVDRAPALANYPHAKIVNNQLVYLSGVSSRRPDGSRRGVQVNADGTFTTSMQEQTRGVIENIKATMEGLGSSLSNIVDLTVFLADMSQYKEFNQAYNEYFSSESGPSRTTIGVAALPHPSLLIEIKAIGLLPKAK